MADHPFLSCHALPEGTCLKHTYLVHDVLGEGGFGITYRGSIKNTGNIIAIKEYFPPSLAVRSRQEGVFSLHPYPEKNTDAFYKGRLRFLKEAEILKSFQKLACIVSVYDLFEENGTAYLVMEYIEGLTLRQYVNDNGTLTFPEISELILPVMQSLAEVHDKGLIHRDISPDNLILGTDNRLHLIDFGAAGNENQGTAQNTIILKAGYAPPEQYIGNGKVGAWIDVYALCATIYFTLTGTAPAEAIQRLDSDAPGPLPGLARLLPWQRAVLEKGLQLRPADRYQNMYSLRSALEGTPEADKDITVIQTSLPASSLHHIKKTYRIPGRIRIPTVIGTFFILAVVVFFLTRYSLTTKERTSSVTEKQSPARKSDILPSPKPSPESTAQTTASPRTKLLTMPSLTGETLEKAKKKLKKLDSSIRIKTTYSYSNDQPAGKVIAQSVAKGVSFSKKQLPAIALTVSKGKTTPKPTRHPTKAPDYHVRKEDDDLTSIPLD